MTLITETPHSRSSKSPGVRRGWGDGKDYVFELDFTPFVSFSARVNRPERRRVIRARCHPQFVGRSEHFDASFTALPWSHQMIDPII